MDNIFFWPIIFLSVCAALFAILITYQLNKKYRLSYLSTYLYFQIFINVFGIYGILGQLIAKKILQQQDSSFQTIETIGHFFSFLGLPFMIFAWYMFIRLCREIVEKKLSRTFNLSYFFALTFVFFAYGGAIIFINLSALGDKTYVYLSSSVLALYVSIEIVVLAVALSQLFVHGRKIKDENKQKAIQNFAFLNLFVYCLGIILFLYSSQKWTLAVFYLFVFISANIPPVLYWRAYLRKHFVAPVLQKVNALAMKKFLEEYGISKREEEVIQQLCEGKTNKEISEALFISLQTVKDHIYRIYQKTDIKNRVQLINLIQSCRSEEE